DGAATVFENMGDQPGRGCFAVRSRDRKNRNTRWSCWWKQHVDHMLGYVAANALGWRKVHTETRRRVDLDDSAAGVGKPVRNIRRDDIYAGDIEPDDPRNSFKQKSVVRMDFLRAVDRGSARRDVRRGLEIQYLVIGQN